MPIDFSPTMLIDRVYGNQVNRGIAVLDIPCADVGGLIVPLSSPDWSFQSIAGLASAGTQLLISNSTATVLIVLAINITPTTAGKLTFQVGASNKIRINPPANLDYYFHAGGKPLFAISGNNNLNIKNDGGAAITFDISILYVQPSVV